ncbi:MAG: PqqD family protein [Planctomycetes bacterium]|nr:PqqD family protein [Planctomycetota bacterium]
MRIRINERTLSQELGDEVVLLQLDTGLYYTLAGTGARMWTLLGRHGEVEPVVAAMSEEFSADPAEVHRDLLALVLELSAARLVEVTGS